MADQLLLQPGIKGYKGLADQLQLQALFDQVLLRAHTCVLQNTQNEGLQRFGRPTATESTQTKQNRRISQHKQGRNLTSASPTNCCCEHTHMCCRMCNPRIKGYKGSTDHFMLRAYTCALQSKSNQGCTYPGVEMLQGSDPTRHCCKYTHVCCRIVKLRVSPKGQL